MNNNLKEVLEKFKIVIPIIQRDYAQGRDNKKTNIIRDNFLKSIFDRLNNNKELHLDFVYGSMYVLEGKKRFPIKIFQEKVYIIKENKSEDYTSYDLLRNASFIPLDGQQRLTTLFLLYWYLGKKSGKRIEFLENFTYETRASSREFCNSLLYVDNNIIISNESLKPYIENHEKNKKILSKYIKDQSWFLSYWENDPTIKSMLNMLDSIHNKIEEEKNKKINISNYFNNLDKITFQFFGLENFGLDDDLYIKMNARGKELTDFEIFKAEFSKLLEDNFKNLKKEFSLKIDKEWTDFFWSYKDANYLIDSAFMRYIYYISEMLFYKYNEKLEKDKDIKDLSMIKSIFNKEENIMFLFKSLDNLKKIHKSFYEIFVEDEYKEGKVILFNSNLNLLEEVINNKVVNLPKKILLFVIMNYFNKEKYINDDFKDFLRVTRNLLERGRSIKNGKIDYFLSLANENIKNILILLNYLGAEGNVYEILLNNNGKFNLSHTSITKDSLEYEKNKASLIEKDYRFKNKIFELEDYKHLKGDIHNFITDDFNSFKFYSDAVKEIYQKCDSLIIRAMLTVGDYKLWRGDAWNGNSKYSKYFLGKQSNWEIILTGESDDNYFMNFLKKYKENNSNLEEMIENYLNNRENKKDWIYYFIKYEEMTSLISKSEGFAKDNNLYIWINDFHIEKLNGEKVTKNKNPINPYLRTVYLKLQDKELEPENWLSKEYDGDDFRSYLKVENTIDKFYIDKDGWHVSFIKNNSLETLKKKLREKFKFSEDNNNHLLIEEKEKSDKDLIEIAIDFLKEIYNTLNK